MDVDSDPTASSKMDLEDQTEDTKGNRKKAEEGSGGEERELTDSIGGLPIGPGRTNFNKKPVIIIVIGMAGASISLVRPGSSLFNYIK